MTWTVCLDCGEPAPATRCPDCQTEREARVTAAKGSATARGYGSAWQRLSARARRLQPFCLDCGTADDLTSDHLVWPARTLADVEVVCRPCNSRRGAVRGAKGRGPNPEVRSLGPVGKAKFPSHSSSLSGDSPRMPSRAALYGSP